MVGDTVLATSDGDLITEDTALVVVTWATNFGGLVEKFYLSYLTLVKYFRFENTWIQNKRVLSQIIVYFCLSI